MLYVSVTSCRRWTMPTVRTTPKGAVIIITIFRRNWNKVANWRIPPYILWLRRYYHYVYTLTCLRDQVPSTRVPLRSSFVRTLLLYLRVLWTIQKRSRDCGWIHLTTPQPSTRRGWLRPVFIVNIIVRRSYIVSQSANVSIFHKHAAVVVRGGAPSFPPPPVPLTPTPAEVFFAG